MDCDFQTKLNKFLEKANAITFFFVNLVKWWVLAKQTGFTKKVVSLFGNGLGFDIILDSTIFNTTGHKCVYM